MLTALFYTFGTELRISKTEPTPENRTEPTPAVAKKGQTEGIGSVSVFASGVTEIFLFLFFPRAIEFLPRARERATGDGSGIEIGRERGGGEGERQNLIAEGNAGREEGEGEGEREGGRERAREGGRGREGEREGEGG